MLLRALGVERLGLGILGCLTSVVRFFRGFDAAAVM